jgi:replicative DNA helicase
MNTINSEKSICSSLMFKNSSVEVLLGTLLPEHFFDDTCRKIYELSTEAYLTRGPFSDSFVLSKMPTKEQEILDITFISPVSNDTLILLADNLIAAHNNRNMLVKIEEIKQAVMEGRDYSLDDLKNVGVSSSLKIKSNKEIIDSMQARIDNPVNDHGTGLSEIDRYLNLEPGNLIVIAARPSMGKTGLVVTIIWHLLMHGEGSTFFSLEMPSEAIMLRMLANKSNETLSDIRHNKIINYPEYKDVVEKLSNSDDFILIDTAVDHIQLYNTAMSLIAKKPSVKNVFIDHLTYIKDPGGYANNHLRIGDVTKTLKRLAKDAGVKVWLLSQLSRGIESRPNKRPQLSDMRESGSIEEDADVILGIYRESYYTSREEAKREDPVNDVEILVLKNRDGEVGGAKTMFIGPHVRFSDEGGYNGHYGAVEVAEYEYVEEDMNMQSSEPLISMPPL